MRRCGDRQPADRGQRDRLPGSFLDAVSGDFVADPVDSLAVRQRGRGRVRRRRRAAGAGPHADVRVIAQGGDGGTTDIGFGCLSGMFERNDDVLYICYDNEAYMNTGVQRSSATPPAARTATTPGDGPVPGQRLRHRQERAADRDGAPHSLCRDRERRQSARSRAQGHAMRWESTARAISTSSCHARSAGVRRRRTRSRSRAWRSSPGFFRCSRREHGEDHRAAPRSGTRSP